MDLWPRSLLPPCPGASSSEFGATDSEFGGSESTKQRFTFTSSGAQAIDFQDAAFVEVLPVQENITIEAVDTNHDLEYTSLGVVHDNNILHATTEVFNVCFNEMENMDTGSVICLPSPVGSDEGYMSAPSPSNSDNSTDLGFNSQDFIPNHEFILHDTNLLEADPQDPSWHPDPVYLKTISPEDDSALYNAILSKTGEKKNKRHEVKHRRGQTRIQEHELVNEDHKKNVERCRQYRDNLKEKELNQTTELDKLEMENARLVQKEKNMRETLERVKKAYLDLIVKGRVKFT